MNQIQETEFSIALYSFSNKRKLSSKELQIHQNLIITNAKGLLDPGLRQNKAIGPICPYPSSKSIDKMLQSSEETESIRHRNEAILW